MMRSRLFRRVELQVLMNLTARALRQSPRCIWTLPNDEALRVYAEYTREHLQGGVDEGLLKRMREEAHRVGKWLRRVFHLRKQADIERFTTILYQHIGIELEGHIPGSLCFSHCFFSHHYTPTICLAASALDEGIISGLSDIDAPLLFQQRMTEGCPCCKATFDTYNSRKHNTQ